MYLQHLYENVKINYVMRGSALQFDLTHLGILSLTLNIESDTQ